MADKLTQKQEAFANKYVECGNASEAYRHAFAPETATNESIWSMASRALADIKVQSRVMELQQAARERSIVSVQAQTARLQKLSSQAEGYDTAPGVTAAISAEKEINKLNGLIVDRSVVDAGITVKGGMGSLYEDLDAEDAGEA